MKKPIYLYSIFMIFLILVCTPLTAQSQEYYTTKIKTWLGHHIDQLVDKWGYPQESFKAPNGNTVYVYHRETEATIYYHTDHFSIPLPARRYCTTYFETDRRGIIVKGRGEGNACE
jgi:hypothetical protein